MKTNLSHISGKHTKKEQYFSRYQISLPNRKKIYHSASSTSSIPTNSESNQSSFSDLTLSEKETSKLFVGPSLIFGLSVNAPPPIRKWKRKKGRSTILTKIPELVKAKEARDVKNQPRKRKKITKRNLNFDF